MNLIYYKDGELEAGPVTQDELDYLVSSGRVNHDSLVRYENETGWQPLRNEKKVKSTRRRPKAKTPVASAVSVAASPAKSDQSPTDEESMPRPEIPAPPIDDSELERRRLRRQILIGVLIALVLLLLLFLLLAFRDDPQGLSTSGDGLGRADSGQTSAAGDSSAQPNSSTADSSGQQTQQPSSATGNDLNQNQDAGSGSGQATPDDVQGASDSDEMTERSQEATDFSLQPPTGVVAADPASKMTITVPGEAMFFGMKATGTRFAFVVDQSGSMSGPRLERAITELLTCLAGLPDNVEVTVAFFSSFAFVNPQGTVTLNETTRRSLRQWVGGIVPSGGTSPQVGTEKVLTPEINPEVVFLLTDGGFESSAISQIARQNRDIQARINTVAFVSRDGEQNLKQIASENDGDYRFVP